MAAIVPPCADLLSAPDSDLEQDQTQATATGIIHMRRKLTELDMESPIIGVLNKGAHSWVNGTQVFQLIVAWIRGIEEALFCRVFIKGCNSKANFQKRKISVLR
jgi:hypothetical protein